MCIFLPPQRRILILPLLGKMVSSFKKGEKSCAEEIMFFITLVMCWGCF